jgi:glycosyltransferase involved in cell wall biosynthesis
MFLLTCRWKGLPNALLEAMAAGLAVVGTRIGGVTEIITHEETGLLIDGIRHPLERLQ